MAALAAPSEGKIVALTMMTWLSNDDWGYQVGAQLKILIKLMGKNHYLS